MKWEFAVLRGRRRSFGMFSLFILVCFLGSSGGYHFMSPQPLENLPQKDVTRVRSLGSAYSIIMLIKRVPGSFYLMLVSFMFFFKRT